MLTLDETTRACCVGTAALPLAPLAQNWNLF